MLVDVTRRPIRLIYEECPSFVVVRTMEIRGRAGGLLHREGDTSRERVESEQFYNDPDNRGLLATYRPVRGSIQPKVTLPHNGYTYIETLLPRDLTRDVYTISGFNDQISKVRGIWRINFIIDQTARGVSLLTLMDETNSTTLFTIQLPPEIREGQELFEVTTPLRRFLNQQNIGQGQGGLWGALLDEF